MQENGERSAWLDGWQDEIGEFVEASRSLFLAVFTVDGQLLDANAAMAPLLGVANPAGQLLNPSLAALTAGASDGTVYDGYMNIGGYSAVSTSFAGRVIRRGERLLIVGEYDAAQLAAQNAIMADLNREVSTLQRRLMQEKHRLEETLAQLHGANEKLQALNATKDRFFSIIAHDLRSPFNAIIGLSSLLAEQVRAGDYDSIDQYADTIVESSEQALTLLTNLLEWSRAQTGRVRFEPQPLPLAGLVAETFNLLRAAARQKELTLVPEIPDSVVVRGDRGMLATVLRNLVANAIKFTPRGGQIRVGAGRVSGAWEIQVKDNGVGIAPERVAALFSLDQNHSTPGTEQERGTGLGLILCREFIVRHGGEIRVESVVGAGSSFFFTLPDSPPA